MTAYVVSGELGVDVFAQVDDVTTPAHPVGKVVTLSDGTKWIYLKASATIAQYDACVSVDNATTQGLTSTLGLRGMAICIAQQEFVSGEYGWFLIANPLAVTDYKVNVAQSCAVDVKLATTATAGVLDDTTAGTVLRVDGIVLTDTNTTSTTSPRTFRTSHYPLGWGAV